MKRLLSVDAKGLRLMLGFLFAYVIGALLLCMALHAYLLLYMVSKGGFTWQELRISGAIWDMTLIFSENRALLMIVVLWVGGAGLLSALGVMWEWFRRSGGSMLAGGVLALLTCVLLQIIFDRRVTLETAAPFFPAGVVIGWLMSRFHTQFDRWLVNRSAPGVPGDEAA